MWHHWSCALPEGCLTPDLGVLLDPTRLDFKREAHQGLPSLVILGKITSDTERSPMSKVTKWTDMSGIINFYYGKYKWLIIEQPGLGITMSCEDYTLSVTFGTYPKPMLIQQILDDFFRLHPRVKRGTYAWHEGYWHKEAETSVY